MSANPNRIIVESPSNIAFIKYWGKFDRQYPLNPSISMTLNKCKTIMDIEYSFEGPHVDLYFENEYNQKFSERIAKYLDSIEDVFPRARELTLKIKSENTFPHSAGIASSASAMSALGFALEQIRGESSVENASRYARMASGSACRSLLGPYAVWGEHPSVAGSNNDYAIVLEQFHDNFSAMNDSIVLIDSGEKSVSSSAGHALMNTHPYREARIAQANENFRVMVNSMQTGDYEGFGEILENEALSLHALMLTSIPSYILLKPLSLKFIEELRDFRSCENIPVYFTIDAGPNMHVIYPDNVSGLVTAFLEDFSERHETPIIHDNIGMGAKTLT